MAETETETESLLVSNSDILFMILSLLPTEALLRVKSVCRAWAQVISEPAFIRAHSSRPTPITSFITMKLELGENQIQGFTPFQQGAKFPTSISGILSRGFKVVSGSYGLLCFLRSWVFIVGNPAISHWCVLRVAPPNSPFMFHNAMLIYDPAVSTHFELAVILIKLDTCEELEEIKHTIRFNIYSSETSSWSVSSSITHCWNFEIVSDSGLVRGSEVYRPCKIGGGSICLIDDNRVLVGYEISTDTWWKASTPLLFKDVESSFLLSYNSTIYFYRMGKDMAEVWRLEGKDSWVLESQGPAEVIERVIPTLFAYDPARGALIAGGRDNGVYFTLHLTSSRLEILSDLDAPEFQSLHLHSWEWYDHPIESHFNTLAPLHGAERGLDGLAREFCRLGLRPLNL